MCIFNEVLGGFSAWNGQKRGKVYFGVLVGFLYFYTKNHKLAAAKEMRNAKLRLEQAKKRVGELDKLIKSVFQFHFHKYIR